MKLLTILSSVYFFILPVLAYDNLFIFGDSLSDVGNAANIQDLNHEGRWSNGLVWCEYLAEKLGVDAAFSSKNYASGEGFSAGNINFAYGGAMTSFGTTSITGILSIDEQIYGEKNILGHIIAQDKGFMRYGANFGSNDIVAMWAGANNLFFAGTILILEDFEGTARRAANDMLANISNIISSGAKNILLLNLPDIGLTPCYVNDPVGKANASLFSSVFNATLQGGLADIESFHPDVNLINIDMFAMFNEILANPSLYGFSHTSVALLDVYNNSNMPSQEEASKYLFYDDVHPTTAGHSMLANLIYAQIPEPADYALIFSLPTLFFALFLRKRKRD